MQRLRSSGFRALVAALGIGFFGCKVADRAPPPTAPPDAAARPRNASEIARGLADGRLGVLVHLHRAGGAILGRTFAAMAPWGPLLRAAAIDPTRDLVRACLTSPKVSGEGAVAVIEHRIPEPRLTNALDVLVKQSGDRGEWFQVEAGAAEAPIRVAHVSIDGDERAIALVGPDMIVVLPVAAAAEAQRFVGTGGCAEPTGPEVVLITLRDPATALAGAGFPALPETLRSASLTATLTRDGGLDLALEARSTTPEQAEQDALRLTKLSAEATITDLGFVRVSLFDPPTFQADGERITAERHLSATELTVVLGIAKQALAGPMAPDAMMGWLGDASLDLLRSVGGLLQQ